MKSIFAKVLFLITSLYFAIPAYASAEPNDFWDKMEQHANNKGAQEKAYSFMSGPLALLWQIVVIIGMAIIVASVIFIAIHALKGFLGKGGVTKPVVKLFAVGLIIGILCTSGGWFGLFKATQQLAVKPATDILTDTVDDGSATTDTAKNDSKDSKN